MACKNWCFYVKKCVEKDEDIFTYWSDLVQYITIGTQQRFNEYTQEYFKKVYGVIWFKVLLNKKQVEEINSHVEWKRIDEKEIRLKRVLLELKSKTDFHESMGVLRKPKTAGGGMVGKKRRQKKRNICQKRKIGGRVTSSKKKALRNSVKKTQPFFKGGDREKRM